MAGSGTGLKQQHGHATAFPDVELRLGLTLTGQPKQPAESGHKCSLCDKSFKSLLARGGHQTAHRKEMAELRRMHDFMVEAPNRVQPSHASIALDHGKKVADASVDLELNLGTSGELDLSLKL